MRRLTLLMVVLLTATTLVQADLQWTRLNGKVKWVNGKTKQLTIQNAEGDLLTVKVDDDIEIVSGKKVKEIKDVLIDDQITLINIPKAPHAKEAKDSEEPPMGGVYKPLR